MPLNPSLLARDKDLADFLNALVLGESIESISLLNAELRLSFETSTSEVFNRGSAEVLQGGREILG